MVADEVVRVSANHSRLNEESESSAFWGFLFGGKVQWAIPWRLGADLNMIRFPHEERGRYISCSMMEHY